MDEWEELGLPRSCVEYEYKTTRITIASDNSIEIPRPYGKVTAAVFAGLDLGLSVCDLG